MTKQETIAKVNKCISSVFTKDDVIKLLEQVEDITIDKQMFKAMLRTFENRLDQVGDQVVDYSSAEFNITYDNVLQLECVGIDKDIIANELEQVFKEYGMEC
jgi:hypothetical protein